MRRRLLAVAALGTLALLAALAASCALGPQRISLARALAGLAPDRAIVFELRLPRALLGAAVGCALAVAGTALQALLRNPLAEPFVLGVSGGAALGGALVLVASSLASQLLAGAGPLLGSTPPVAVGAMAGAAGATLLVFAVGRVDGRLVPETALLVGVIFNAFAAAVISLLKVLVTPVEASRLLYWLMGAIGYEPAGTLLAGALFVLAAVAVLLLYSARLNLLALGDDEAASLGLEVGATRAVVLLAASAATGAAVALSGVVGFVGLIVPHAARRVLGPDHRLLVPASALFGGAFLVLADALARLAFLALGSEPPVGALTAFLGGPLFLWLLRRAERPERG
ncbi:MAG TPA: iron ABC transporter permease [Anaeromyxobacteraceae bacterium]|nr:iron ABC transporter permease [Anaeromyxobacteraceae bacterium]